MKERLVYIEWGDATYNSGYYDKGAPKRYGLTEAKTVGIVIKSDRKEVIVAQEYWLGEDGKPVYRHITTIPKKMIRLIIKLKGE